MASLLATFLPITPPKAAASGFTQDSPLSQLPAAQQKRRLEEVYSQARRDDDHNIDAHPDTIKIAANTFDLADARAVAPRNFESARGTRYFIQDYRAEDPKKKSTYSHKFDTVATADPKSPLVLACLKKLRQDGENYTLKNEAPYMMNHEVYRGYHVYRCCANCGYSRKCFASVKLLIRRDSDVIEMYPSARAGVEYLSECPSPLDARRGNSF